MILIKDTEPSEDCQPVRISASRGRGGNDHSTKLSNSARRKPPTPSHQYKKTIWYG